MSVGYFKIVNCRSLFSNMHQHDRLSRAAELYWLYFVYDPAQSRPNTASNVSNQIERFNFGTTSFIFPSSLSDFEFSQVLRPKNGVFASRDFAISNAGINPKIACAENGFDLVEGALCVVG